MFYASGVMFLVFFPSEPSNGDFPFLALSKLFLSSLRPSCVKKSNDDENQIIYWSSDLMYSRQIFTLSSSIFPANLWICAP